MNNKQCVIWATGNNEEIAKRANGPSITQNSDIGTWAFAAKRDSGNGHMLGKYCQEFEMRALGTHSIPNKKDKSNLTAWRDRNNGAYKLIDYIMVSNEQKWGTRTKTKGARISTVQTDIHRSS